MNGRTIASLAEADNTLRDQLAIAQRKHFDRVVELLTAQKYEIVAGLNQSARRLRAYKNEADWAKSLLDATEGFCDRAALFTVRGGSLRLQATRNILIKADAEIPLVSAPAFASAVESGDTVVAVQSEGEMSGPIASWLGERIDRKFYLFPVSSGSRVVAVLYADVGEGSVQAEALELLVTLAGAVLGSRAADAPNGLVHLATCMREDRSSPSPGIDREVDIHLKAQRFALVQVAEMRLYKSENVKNGRTQHDLYTSLKIEIDSAREVFRRDFLSAPGGMLDYLHLELVRTLANDDVALLGPHYPGPMV
jgi:hypothetical protein